MLPVFLIVYLDTNLSPGDNPIPPAHRRLQPGLCPLVHGATSRQLRRHLGERGPAELLPHEGGRDVRRGWQTPNCEYISQLQKILFR